MDSLHHNKWGFFVQLNVTQQIESTLTHGEDTPVGDTEVEDDIKPFLISKTDNSGEYYPISNSRGEHIKFYFQKDVAKLATKLDTSADYPFWCKHLSVFCERWKLDDITKTTKLTDAEEDILGTVINDSLGKNFRSYVMDDMKASEKFLRIQDTMKSQCNREVKDRMWRDIRVDNTCSSYNDLTETLSKLCTLELYTQDSLMPISNEFLNIHIKRTLIKDLALSLEIYIHGDQQLKVLQPRDVIQAVVEAKLSQIRNNQKNSEKLTENHTNLEDQEQEDVPLANTGEFNDIEMSDNQETESDISTNKEVLRNNTPEQSETFESTQEVPQEVEESTSWKGPPDIIDPKNSSPQELIDKEVELELPDPLIADLTKSKTKSQSKTSRKKDNPLAWSTHDPNHPSNQLKQKLKIKRSRQQKIKTFLEKNLESLNFPKEAHGKKRTLEEHLTEDSDEESADESSGDEEDENRKGQKQRIRRIQYRKKRKEKRRKINELLKYLDSRKIRAIYYKEAITNNSNDEERVAFQEAYQKELNNLVKAKVYDPTISIPRKQINPEKIISINTIFSIKRDGLHKARIVARGDLQSEGSYHDTDTSLLNMESLKLFLIMSFEKNLYVRTIDINHAFLYAPIEEEL
ncbi:hypothetical protein DAKH74_050890 [Maudiozyma humilis]|uniref:Reverse transcriptase Ty1/copia-type domain-containing protein n=1 Tax=Maudiozyma humilis TaxID=51915 RepID=A0AAV5S4C2_MAUHU|nr:hypothetical protein DAKH74_050890 [Kazachstania humilis]